jgi:2-polyprenyl-3-methyl-5-hydroxy-6-metoxy-1,4-benzoquinol methylase
MHTVVNCLQRELKECETVLDLGCGPNSPLQYCKNIKYSVGVETFEPYLIESRKRKIHSEYIAKSIMDVDFSENSFDAVIMIEVLEHLPDKDGLEILKRIEKWAKKVVLVSSPNGFLDQKELDNNPLQKHLSGWDYKRMVLLGYKCYGLAGLRQLRQEVQDSTMGDNIMTSMKYSPKWMWFIVATLSQMFTYYFPKNAFELFSVKRRKR